MTNAPTIVLIASVLRVTLTVTGCVVTLPRLKVMPSITLSSVLLLDWTAMPLIVACALAADCASVIWAPPPSGS